MELIARFTPFVHKPRDSKFAAVHKYTYFLFASLLFLAYLTFKRQNIVLPLGRETK